MKNTFRLIRNALSAFANRQPWMIISIILIVLILLVVVNAALLNTGYPLGTPLNWFPISVFPASPTLHTDGPAAGIPYTMLFLVFLSLGVGLVRKLTVPWLFALSAALLLSGNLIQGDLSSAFIRPFTASGIQYYHDAVKIEEPLRWLSTFNEYQLDLLCHSKVHPPFAVLAHWMFLSPGGTIGLSCAFIALSLVQIPLFYAIAVIMTPEKDSAKALTLLYSVLPAINIYSAICLDALIAVAFLCALLGLVLIDRKLSVPNVVLFAAGVCIANALTFVAAFLIALSVAVGIYRAVFSRSRNILIGCIFTGCVALLLYTGAFHFLGYDHLQAFFTACRVDNQIRLIQTPWNYLGTRIEGLSEILLFLGVGVLALLIRDFPLVIKKNSDGAMLVTSSLFVLLLMFATGACCHGETARICMFIYPYLLMCASRSSLSSLRDMIVWAGMQTAAMQTLGSYFW